MTSPPVILTDEKAIEPGELAVLLRGYKPMQPDPPALDAAMLSEAISAFQPPVAMDRERIGWRRFQMQARRR